MTRRLGRTKRSLGASSRSGPETWPKFAPPVAEKGRKNQNNRPNKEEKEETSKNIQKPSQRSSLLGKTIFSSGKDQNPASLMSRLPVAFPCSNIPQWKSHGLPDSSDVATTPSHKEFNSAHYRLFFFLLFAAWQTSCYTGCSSQVTHSGSRTTDLC